MLDGGSGRDGLFGGTGADQFVFRHVESFARGTFDTIADFSTAEGDKVDLSGMDADRSVAGNQAFDFIGRSAFTGEAGELRYEVYNNCIVVYGDVNGDRKSDFGIQINHVDTIGETTSFYEGASSEPSSRNSRKPSWCFSRYAMVSLRLQPGKNSSTMGAVPAGRPSTLGSACVDGKRCANRSGSVAVSHLRSTAPSARRTQIDVASFETFVSGKETPWVPFFMRRSDAFTARAMHKASHPSRDTVQLPA